MKTLKVIIYILILVMSLGIFSSLQHMTTKLKRTPKAISSGNIYIGGTRVHVEVAHTLKDRAKGLSGRKSIPLTNGMVLAFPKDDIYPIWMKGMQFPLDIYWVSKDGVVVDKWQNAQPESYPSVYTPKRKARYVIEVTAGFSEVYNIEIGDEVTGLSKL